MTEKWERRIAYCAVTAAFLVVGVRSQLTSEDASDIAKDNIGLIAKVDRQQKQLDAQQAEIVEGLVDSCREAGNPLRQIVREVVKKEITNVNDPRLGELLPGTPHDVIVRIVRQGNKEAREQLAKIQNVSCAQQYQPDSAPTG